MTTLADIAAVRELINNAVVNGESTAVLRKTLSRLEEEHAAAEAAAQALAAAGTAQAEAAREARIAEIAAHHAEAANTRLRDLASRVAIPPAPAALLKDTNR